MPEIILVSKYQDAGRSLAKAALRLHRYSKFALEYMQMQENIKDNSADALLLFIKTLLPEPLALDTDDEIEFAVSRLPSEERELIKNQLNQGVLNGVREGTKELYIKYPIEYEVLENVPRKDCSSDEDCIVIGFCGVFKKFQLADEKVEQLANELSQSGLFDDDELHQASHDCVATPLDAICRFTAEIISSVRIINNAMDIDNKLLREFSNEELADNENEISELFALSTNNWHEYAIQIAEIPGIDLEEIATALSIRIHDNGAGRTDSTDNGTDNQENLPISVDVRDLCFILKKELLKGRSKIDIAREFTSEVIGQDLKAKNLLRQADRFSHIWKPQNKKQTTDKTTDNADD